MSKCKECGRIIPHGFHKLCPECEKELKEVYNIVAKKELDRDIKKYKKHQKNMVYRMAELFEEDSE